MEKNNKKSSVPKPRTDRGTFDKEKNSERHRWKQNMKNMKFSSDETDELNDDAFEDEDY